MKKTIIICDKCGKEIPEGKATTIMNEVDICPKCWPKLQTALMDWLKQKTEDVKPKKQPAAEPEKPDPPEDKVDLGKMQALRNGNWSVKDIAKEMKVSESFVYSHTSPPPKKKAYPNEFNAADPREAVR